MSLDSVCHLDAPRKAAMRRLIERAVRRGELVPVKLEGAGKMAHWAQPEALERRPEPAEAVHILSPFDPLVIQRKRLQPLLRLRAPFRGLRAEGQAHVRLLRAPVLVGDDIVAVLDLKTDRERQKLLMQKWTWIKPRRAPGAIEEALHRFERFQLGR